MRRGARGLAAVLLVVRVLVFVVMDVDRHADEESSQEGEDERLQEGDEDFEQADRDRAHDDDGRDAEADAGAQCLDCREDQAQQNSQQNMPGDHVGEQSDGECEGLGDQPDELHRDEKRREPQRPGAEVLDVAHAAVAQAVDDHHHQSHDRQRTGHPDVAGGGAAQVRAEQGRDGRNRQETQHVDGEDEEEGAPDVADEAIGVDAQDGLGDLLAQILADGLEEVREAGGNQAADRVASGAAPHQDRHQKGQEEAGDQHHDDLVGEHGDDTLGSEHPEVGRDLLQRVLNHVAQGILGRHHPASLRSSVLQSQVFAALRRPSNHHVSTANSAT